MYYHPRTQQSLSFLRQGETGRGSEIEEACKLDQNLDNRDDFTFAKLSDLKLPVIFHISQLEGSIPQLSVSKLLENPELRFHGSQSSWNEWITLPIRYCDLPSSLTLCRGKHCLLLWVCEEADSSMQTETPSKLGIRDEMGRLEKLVKKYECGDLLKSDWLDNMAFRKMEDIHAHKDSKRIEGRDRSQNMYLYVDLPRFDFPCPESDNNTTCTSSCRSDTSHTCTSQSDPHLWAILDPEISHESPVEDKHHQLVWSHQSRPYNRELKPNAKLRDELNEILNYAPSQPLNSEEKDLIWKFHFYLTWDKRGLTNFLKSVTWRNPSEVKQAVEELLPMWTEVDTNDPLELLGPGTGNSRVRVFAVQQLIRADDEELLLYLLQLIQALKFESAASEQRLNFLIVHGVQNHILGNQLYWYLIVEVELEDRVVAKMYGRVVFKFLSKILESEDGSECRELMRRQGILKLHTFINDSKNGLVNIPPLPLPPVFKLNLYPFLLYFQCSDGTENPVIFKYGDDMCQVQLVPQLFTLMDQSLRKENLDLKLIPYDVLVTGPLQGMAQFIPSKTITAIISENGMLFNYLRANNPHEGGIGTYGVEPMFLLSVYTHGKCVSKFFLSRSLSHLFPFIHSVKLIVSWWALYPEQSLYVLRFTVVKSINVYIALVLGMCFFAGGLCFSEQGFGQSMQFLVLSWSRLLMHTSMA
ncbi:putative atypical/PIKK/PI3K protein kinase [Suillus bovinus]|uniref:putative atypical/PIKK/PI3K protein kinase n=1 Tax=Suillus bovinus TaxID=48563 RepID=UPI001B883B6B|nr:putative atypical/PIKK/PI3K protein kinase [Suillus bovinus]KAG2131308.1 putative atypical/PIKK/PI3K protein kinase [Suillus bovinus]